MSKKLKQKLAGLDLLKKVNVASNLSKDVTSADIIHIYQDSIMGGLSRLKVIKPNLVFDNEMFDLPLFLELFGYSRRERVAHEILYNLILNNKNRGAFKTVLKRKLNVKGEILGVLPEESFYLQSLKDTIVPDLQIVTKNFQIGLEIKTSDSTSALSKSQIIKYKEWIKGKKHLRKSLFLVSRETIEKDGALIEEVMQDNELDSEHWSVWSWPEFIAALKFDEIKGREEYKTILEGMVFL